MKRYGNQSIATTIVSTLLLSSFIILTGMISIGSSVPSFSLEDQYEKKWKRSDYKGKPALYIMCDLAGYEYSGNWTNSLVSKYKGSIHFIPVADVSTAPGFMKGYIRGRFKDEFSYPVLLDWKGKLIKALNMKPGYPTLVLTNENGVVQYRSYGKGTSKQVARLKKKIEGLIN